MCYFGKHVHRPWKQSAIPVDSIVMVDGMQFLSGKLLGFVGREERIYTMIKRIICKLI